jgi:hypothetical protein
LAEANAFGALGGAGAVIAGAAAGAAGAITARPRNTGALGAPGPGATPGGWAAIERVSDTGRVGAGNCGGVGGIVIATAGCGGSGFADGATAATGSAGPGGDGFAAPAELAVTVGPFAAGTFAAGTFAGGPFAAKAGDGIAVARTLVTMARAATGVFSGSPGRSISEKTTPAPAIAPIAVATRTTRAVRAKLGAGAI